MSFELRGETLGADVYVGSFRPNGSSALVASQNRGSGFSVTYTSTGLYTLVLRGLNGRQVVSAIANIRLAAFADTFMQVGTVTLSGGNATITLRSVTAGVLADVASNAGNVISFAITVA